ncbi:hypothetical protein [Candidatus Neptunochlamydia vexilliferae]|uniref:Uncharacterized protein n=1 Tax=Candidatus Neptunichlamydia vexilliferae TaxID=1651774 RepID=A0ABS0B3P7_9BACT|nr:hypothetical protein [Candidatus Neptunochlamydia vexilliferae]MBF5060220.1 hypothetical protein [Candidatus Neptunochlamydia vexilliferae]
MSIWSYVCCSPSSKYDALDKKDEDCYLDEYRNWMETYKVENVPNSSTAKQMAESLIQSGFSKLGQREHNLIGIRLRLVAECGLSFEKAIEAVLKKAPKLGKPVRAWQTEVSMADGLSSQSAILFRMKNLAEKSVSPTSINVTYNLSSAKGLILSRNQILTMASLFENAQKNKISIGKVTFPFNPSQDLSVPDKRSNFAVIKLNATFKATLKPMINSNNLPILGDPIYLFRTEKKAPYEVAKGFFGKRYGLQMHYSVSSPIFGALVIDSQKKVIAFHSHEVTCECTGQQKCSVGVLAQSILKLSNSLTKK